MTWFFVVVVVLAMGGIALVASGRGAPMLDEYDDRPDAVVPGGDLGPQDLRRVRFSIGFRGYRMSEVDALLARLATEMEADRTWQPRDEADGARHEVEDAPQVSRGDDVPPE